MKLIWLDLETTGLDPNSCDVLEVAALGADISDPTTTEHLINTTIWHGGGGISSKIKEFHKPSGLIRECRTAPGLWVVGPQLEAAIKAYVGDGADKPMLAGASVHFDLSFVRRHWPYVAGLLSHRVFDTSAITAFCCSLGMPYPQDEPATAHRAMPDTLASIERYKRCRNWLKENGLKPCAVTESQSTST